jgi:tetratricopeptide (TPR) repeat protein
MKKITKLLVVAFGTFSMGCFAQDNELIMVNEKMGNAQLMSDNMSDNDLAIVSYHVEERINATFGGSITTYNVSNISLVNTYDLGGNNSRVVTPKYGKVKTRPMISSIVIMNPIGITPAPLKPIKLDVFVPKETPKTVYIDFLSTYERILEKGYRAEDMLRRVADKRYFDGDFAIAAKWYEELFKINPKLDAVYYFRYGKSLVSIGQTQKGNELIATYEKMDKGQ